MPSQRNILLRLEYHGTNYHGFQIQKNAPTIQGVIEEALATLTKEKIRIASASRTDAGVHALDHVITFKTQTTLPIRAFSHGLNQLLPHNIRIQEAHDMPLSFQVQKMAYKKEYAYFIVTDKKNHVMNKYSWNLFADLELEPMQKCLSLIVGKHDFSSFRASDCDSVSPIREIHKARITRIKNPFLGKVRFYKITIQGNGFLKHMVRNIVGTLVDVGTGKTKISDFKKIIASHDRTKAGMTAPAQGLFLMKTWIKLKN